MKKYLYSLLARYVGLFARTGDRLVNLDSTTESLDDHLPGAETLTLQQDDGAIRHPDYILLNGTLHYERDIQG